MFKFGDNAIDFVYICSCDQHRVDLVKSLRRNLTDSSVEGLYCNLFFKNHFFCYCSFSVMCSSICQLPIICPVCTTCGQFLGCIPAILVLGFRFPIKKSNSMASCIQFSIFPCL